MPKQPANTCSHEHTVLDATGSMHFEAGEVWDDYHTEVICLDCGAVLSPDIEDVWEDLYDLA